MVDISNSNLVKNVGGLLFKRTGDEDVEWIGPHKKRLPDNCYKMPY